MLKNLRLSQQALILILLPLICEIGFITLLGIQLHDFDRLLNAVNTSRMFGNHLNAFVDDIAQVTKMVDDIKQNERHNQAVAPEALSELKHRLTVLDSELHVLTANAPNEDMKNKVLVVSGPLRKVSRIIGVAVDTYDSGGVLSLYALMSGQDEAHTKVFFTLRNQLFESLDSLLQAKHDQQLDLDNKITRQEASFKRLISSVIAGAITNIVLAAFLWVTFSRGTAESFRVLVDNTTRLAKGQPLNPPIGGSGEIAHLDRYFKDMADALEKARKERERIEQMKQEFVAMVSHDLRTPLTSVQACLTLLNTGVYGKLNDQGAENVELAESNVSRLIALINDLLDIEKMESGKLVMEFSTVSVADLMTRLQAAISGFAHQQGVQLEVESTSARAFADGDRLVQVLVNLVSNAIKFSSKGQSVRVTTQELTDCLEVKVIDQGRGIPEEFKHSVFERFEQVKVSDAKVKGGSGLGLSICKAIVEGHGGTIGVQSEEGKGSTFWFRIPKQALGDQNSTQSPALGIIV